MLGVRGGEFWRSDREGKTAGMEWEGDGALIWRLGTMNSSG